MGTSDTSDELGVKEGANIDMPIGNFFVREIQ